MSSSIRLEKPWKSLVDEEVDRLPGQLGVYQLADEAGEILFIGFAGGNSLFGLRSELGRWLEDPDSRAKLFRCEVNMQYMTRHQELLMIFVADHGRLPSENRESLSELGRLRFA